MCKTALSRLVRAGAFVAGVGFSTSVVQATLIAHDHFDGYKPGTILSGLGGGTGWSGAWKSRPAVTVSNETIVYDFGGVTLGGGNSLKIAEDFNNSMRASLSRTLKPQGGADCFVSFIFQVRTTNPTDTGNVSGSRFTGWQALDGDADANNDTLGYVGASNRVGARVANASVSVAGTSIRYNRTYFVVIGYTGWDGSTYRTVNVWLNPTADAAKRPASIFATHTAEPGGGSGGLFVRAVGLDDARIYQLIDDLRVGSTWASVVTSPQPSR